MQQQMVRHGGMMRVDPTLPVGAVETFQIAAPRSTHWRSATCAEVQCQPHLSGWVTKVLAGSPDEQLLRQARRNLWSRVEAAPDGFLNYHFTAGVKCLGAVRHRIRIDRPELFVLRDGDWRWLGEPRVFDRSDQWVDHFATRLDQIKTAIERN